MLKFLLIFGFFIPFHLADRCEYLVDAPQCEPTDVCLSVTSYWPYVDVDGEWVAQAWNGQADSDPHMTAAMYPLTPDDAGKIAATPLPLIGTEIVLNTGNFNLQAFDTFGHPIYQAGGFWHSQYKKWVIPVDVLSPVPIHYLECDYEIVPK